MAKQSSHFGKGPSAVMVLVSVMLMTMAPMASASSSDFDRKEFTAKQGEHPSDAHLAKYHSYDQTKSTLRSLRGSHPKSWKGWIGSIQDDKTDNDGGKQVYLLHLEQEYLQCF